MAFGNSWRILGMEQRHVNILGKKSISFLWDENKNKQNPKSGNRGQANMWETTQKLNAKKKKLKSGSYMDSRKGKKCRSEWIWSSLVGRILMALHRKHKDRKIAFHTVALWILFWPLLFSYSHILFIFHACSKQYQ